LEVWKTDVLIFLWLNKKYGVLIKDHRFSKKGSGFCADNFLKALGRFFH